MKRLYQIIIFMMVSCATLVAQETSFRIALLTDLHFGPGRVEAKEALEECVADINAQQEEPVDLVLVLGDISESGDAASLQEAHDVLSALQPTFYAVPGNHETKWSESLATAFSQVYGYDRFSFDMGGFRFIGVNTGPIIRMMDGHLYPVDLQYIERELKSMPEGTRAILATHYPLLPSDVDNWYVGTQLLRQHPVALVVGGHYHSDRRYFYDGVPALLSRSTLPDKEGMAGYTILEISGDVVRAYERRPQADEKVFWAEHKLGLDETQPQEALPDDSANGLASLRIKEVWREKNHEAFLAAPAVSGGALFAANDAGDLIAYDLNTGAELWTQKTGGRVIGAPQANDTYVAVGNASGGLYCYDVKDGQLFWQKTFPSPLSGAIEFYGDTLYIGDTAGTMHALSLSRGELLWSAEVGANYIEARPFVDETSVAFGAWDQHLYMLDRLTGDLQWQWRGPKPGMHFSPAAVWPVANERYIFVTAPDRVLTAIDRATGATVQRHTGEKVRETVALSKDGKRLYSKTMQDEVLCFTPDDRLEILWRCDAQYGYDHAASMPLELGETLVAVTKNGLLVGIDAISGVLQWSYKIGNTLIQTPIAVGPRSFAYTTVDGVVGIIELK
ncbi:MAG: PQQ-binding-like beta-propeller repeat protein [Porphyromonas sp.]|nr:PQQ-binding-like beta-propeller repeat protein [Porphyromonas sp.]